MAQPEQDPPTLISLLMEFQEAAMQQGLAVGRGDQPAAARHHREGLAVLDRILTMTGERQARPTLNAVPE